MHSLSRANVLAICAAVVCGLVVCQGAAATGSENWHSAASSAKPFAEPTYPTLASLEALVNTASTIQTLPSTLEVPLAQVPNDTPSSIAKGCLVSPTATTALGSRPTDCYFGDVKAKKTLFLFGDSNAWMWLPAFNQIGIVKKFRVELDARADCEVANLPLLAENVNVAGSKGCTLFRQYVLKRISQVKPFVTVLVDYEYFDHFTYAGTPYTQAEYLAGLQSTVSKIKRAKSRPIMMSPPPPQLSNPVVCLSENPTSIQTCATEAQCLNGANAALSACTFSQDGSNLSIANIVGLSNAVKESGGTYVSVAALFCTSSTCPPVIDDTVAFFDQAHVSAHYSLLVEGALSQLFPKNSL